MEGCSMEGCGIDRCNYGEPLSDIAKLCIWAAILWIGGSIVFLVAAYKIYQPKQPQPQPSPYSNMSCGCMQ